jgi:hypothetical protein
MAVREKSRREIVKGEFRKLYPWDGDAVPPEEVASARKRIVSELSGSRLTDGRWELECALEIARAAVKDGTCANLGRNMRATAYAKDVRLNGSKAEKDAVLSCLCEVLEEAANTPQGALAFAPRAWTALRACEILRELGDARALPSMRAASGAIGSSPHFASDAERIDEAVEELKGLASPQEAFRKLAKPSGREVSASSMGGGNSFLCSAASEALMHAYVGSDGWLNERELARARRLIPRLLSVGSREELKTLKLAAESVANLAAADAISSDEEKQRKAESYFASVRESGSIVERDMSLACLYYGLKSCAVSEPFNSDSAECAVRMASALAVLGDKSALQMITFARLKTGDALGGSDVNSFLLGKLEEKLREKGLPEEEAAARMRAQDAGRRV